MYIYVHIVIIVIIIFCRNRNLFLNLFFIYMQHWFAGTALWHVLPLYLVQNVEHCTLIFLQTHVAPQPWALQPQEIIFRRVSGTIGCSVLTGESILFSSFQPHSVGCKQFPVHFEQLMLRIFTVVMWCQRASISTSWMHATSCPDMSVAASMSVDLGTSMSVDFDDRMREIQNTSTSFADTIGAYSFWNPSHVTKCGWSSSVLPRNKLLKRCVASVQISLVCSSLIDEWMVIQTICCGNVSVSQPTMQQKQNHTEQHRALSERVIKLFQIDWLTVYLYMIKEIGNYFLLHDTMSAQ